MNAESHTEPEIAEYPEAGPFWVGLWAVARHWVGLLEQMFEPDVIAATGLSRSLALRCCKWLWSIEGLVRRLIIAAAMKLDLSALPRQVLGRRPPAKRSRREFRFIVLPPCAVYRPHAAHARPPRAQPAHGNPPRAFPGDALLHLFAPPQRRSAPSRGALNPLQRRGRRSRWDPDYGYDPVKARESYNRHFFGPFRKYPDATEPAPPPREVRRADRSSPYWKPKGGDPEWKRIELEWERVTPAPRLAGRIRALVRVLEHPDRLVARTARRLHAEAGLFEALRDIPPPKFRKPKFDRGGPPPLEAELAQAQACAFPDTS